jgi:hypothetical protein
VVNTDLVGITRRPMIPVHGCVKRTEYRDMVAKGTKEHLKRFLSVNMLNYICDECATFIIVY